ncbi:MAG: FumA C-terminus/TtdB family hydratase beta subunit [Anaerolineae bacterium]
MTSLTIPISDEAIRALHVGETVSLSGVMLTARDAAHKYMVENFIRTDQVPASEQEMYEKLKADLDGGVIYHCGPVVKKENGTWRFVAAGPTTSIREEVYEPEVIEHFNVKAVIGKGGMGPNTLKACEEHAAVYLQAVGGAASLIANAVVEVLGVYKLEFGVPEAFWKIRVENFPAVVTMDSHGRSLHDDILEKSRAVFQRLMAA